MQTVLVAGGAGFIGSNLCERLLDKNYRVICIDNLITGSKENIDDFTKNKNFSFLNLDITSFSFQNIKLPKIDYIFHLASPASPNKKPKELYKFSNRNASGKFTRHL